MSQGTLDDSLSKLRNLKNKPDGMTSKEWSSIKKDLNELQKRGAQNFDPKQHKAEAQSSLAKLFIKFYFATIFVVLIFVPLYNYIVVKWVFNNDNNIDSSNILSVRDAFMMVSSAITPLLAFVLGHYFKGRE